MNLISDEKFKLLREALRLGYSLRRAAKYAGVAKLTVFRYRALREQLTNSSEVFVDEKDNGTETRTTESR